MGGIAVLNKYGPDYFREIRDRRTNYPKQDAQDLPRKVISPRIISARQNGKLGGLARAKLHRPEELTTWARAGGHATRERYGKDYYREIRKLRTEYRKGYVNRKTKEKQRAMYNRLANSGSDPISAVWRFLANKTE